MRTFLLIPLAGCLALARLSAAPTAQEQANYSAACVEAVAAVNAYRDSFGKDPLTPLVPLCQAAREDAEFQHLGVGVAKTIFDRAWDAGYTGTFLIGTTAFSSKGSVAASALFQRLVAANPDNQAAFLSDDAASIGVGLALEAAGAGSEYRLRILLGRKVGMSLGGPTGQESGTGRGLLDLALLRELLAGAWSGDSINGFVRDPSVIVLTVAEERAFASALATFVRKRSVVRLRVGRAVNLRLPPEVAKFIEKPVLKGRMPPGIRFDRRRIRFLGAAKGTGRFTVTLSGDLRGTIQGSKKLKPVRIRFSVGR